MPERTLKTPLRRHGGKHFTAAWILSHFPDRSEWHLYREPYFGGGSVLLRIDPEEISEAVNDLDRGLTAFWNTLQDPSQFTLLQRWLEATPFSEIEWEVSNIEGALTETQRGFLFFIRARQSRQGLGKDFATPTTRIRRGMNENVSAWLTAVEGLPDIHARLKRVEIRCMDAIDFIKKYDHPKALYYIDPPYLPETRTVTDAYLHEMTYDQHCHLLNTLASLEGKFLLSGYPSSLYDGNAKANGWRKVEKQIDNKAGSGETKRVMTEVLYMNY